MPVGFHCFIHVLVQSQKHNELPVIVKKVDIQRRIDIFLKELKDAWKKVIELEFTVTQQESNPIFMQVLVVCWIC